LCRRKKGDSLLFSVVADLCAPEASSTGKKVDCPLFFPNYKGRPYESIPQTRKIFEARLGYLPHKHSGF